MKKPNRNTIQIPNSKNDFGFIPRSFVERIQKYQSTNNRKEESRIATSKNSNNKPKKRSSKKNKSIADDFESSTTEFIQDKVFFGEVALEPPQLTSIPKPVYKNFSDSHYKKRILDEERNKVIQAYKNYKIRNNKKLSKFKK